jgi:hypothetical protein
MSPTSTSVLPFWVALALGVGSLLCYLTFAALARLASDGEEQGVVAFNLGLPSGQNYPQLSHYH